LIVNVSFFINMDELDLDACVVALEQVVRWDSAYERGAVWSSCIPGLKQPLEIVLAALTASSELRHRVMAMCIFGMQGSLLACETVILLDSSY